MPAVTVIKDRADVPVVKAIEKEAVKELELPPLAVALLLDEWRRATMEGQGGMFVRLPRERYDGEGNLWSVVRRLAGDTDVIVLVREAAHYQARAASNEVTRCEGEIGRKLRALEGQTEALENALRTRDTLKSAQVRETIEALEEDLRGLAERTKSARVTEAAASLQEWEFGLGLAGWRLHLGRE
jgi:hypothetical protein